MSAPAISIQNLVRRFGDVEALRGVDLAVSGPGVFGFLGVNGAGKTTTFRILTGLIRPTSGQVRVFDEPVTHGSSALHHRLGYLPQEPTAYDWMTGEEFLMFVGDVFGLGRHRARSRTGELLEQCGLADAARRRVGGYSGGMRQRLGIAQALVNAPDLLLLDEPVSSLDPVGRAEVLDLIVRLGRSATVFMSSHILADIERVCDEVAIIDRGRIVARERTVDLRNRYIRPVFDLTVAGDPGALLAEAGDLPGVVEARETGRNGESSTVRVTVSDLRLGQQALPALIARLGLPLIAFTTSTPTLEEVFMQLIGRDADRSQRGSAEGEAE